MSDDGASAFLLGTRVWDDTTTTSYFHVVPSLDAGTSVRPERALEVPGAAKLYAAYDLGWFAVGSGESPEIARYTLDDNGNLVNDARLSFQAYGVGSLWDTLYFVSPTKAYYPDRQGGQLIIWNPTEMRVLGSVALPETLRDGYLALYGYAPIVRDGELLISVGWFDWDVNDAVLPETGLLVLDTTTDAVVRFDVDSRCGGVTYPIATPSGDTYLISSALAGAAYRLGRLDSAPCALRVAAGAERIDPSYFVDLADVTSGQLAGEPVPGPDGSVFLRVFDEALAAPTQPMATWELTGRAAWGWWQWAPTEASAQRVASLPPSTADVLWFQLDGHVYGTETTEDYSTTTLIDIGNEDGPQRALTVPGFLHGVARIR
ncbi:MAG TPA: hypothetical protein VMG12_23725 [Polyangiaceae bacterium]|nr:hypothetical protein [Polyangiaceae bacterium]